MASTYYCGSVYRNTNLLDNSTTFHLFSHCWKFLKILAENSVCPRLKKKFKMFPHWREPWHLLWKIWQRAVWINNPNETFTLKSTFIPLRNTMMFTDILQVNLYKLKFSLMHWNVFSFLTHKVKVAPFCHFNNVRRFLMFMAQWQFPSLMLYILCSFLYVTFATQYKVFHWMLLF